MVYLQKKTKHSKIPVKNEETIKLGEPRFTLSLTNWIINPDLGIYEFQSLMKASAFIVKANIINPDDNQYHIVTSNHNVAPWLYPKYYPQDFMSQINENHTFYTLELRSQNGGIYTQLDTRPYIFHHPDKDIAVLHLENETSSLELIKQVNFQILDLEEYAPSEDEKLTFYGHEVFEDTSNAWDGVSSSESPNSLSSPRTVNGYLAGRTKYQTFAKTEKILTPGMCGGVAVSKRGSICGMIEGIVPNDHPNHVLRNLAVIIESNEIKSFLKDVEEVKNNNLRSSEKVCVLFGGESLDDLEANTPDMSIYDDPMKVLHNTMFPEDKDKPNSNFTSRYYQPKENQNK